jgi:hypothetical protein
MEMAKYLDGVLVQSSLSMSKYLTMEVALQHISLLITYCSFTASRQRQAEYQQTHETHPISS